MGGHLARLELRLVFQQLAERFAEFAADGRAERVPSCNVEGLKTFPVRARLAGAEEGA